MGDEVEITLVVENSVYKSQLLAEHGLSFWIDYDDSSYLFDTGQGQVLTHNLKTLNLNISELSGVLLSHGHYDHAGGLSAILEQQPEVPVYGHPDLFLPKYSQNTAGEVFRGFAMTKDEINNFNPNTDLTAVQSGLWLTGEVPRKNERETLNDHYQVKEDRELKTDPFRDDQSLVLDTEEGLVIILGCSHAGVINILEHVQQNFAQEIYTIIGGMHLVNASRDRIEWTIEQLQKIDFTQLIPLHCTGERAVRAMQSAFGERVETLSVGDKIKLKGKK
ncbi:MBL fold metallo-hydrolase [Halanaerobacter jeridensis]|uniref:7, 8-dihydropterin-6-yl-methyl-4-(Beta-D-ribofuranosyl)aminobenzene 5'-phosphate synthase n=1 Tax=Halanaerobacter jeridensis TaxID=706427 RepID=A0A938XU61_9FIRM|nr:MBL fold metallo-hydrolase [Halanaerobacter jeridensis]MBM7556376.1 7,8-dihydropterin-6-yl-methyl-4-(beta-D-ribofuranosyl)aminobenzene 5'-phosphate synthase [Halanaerobacter jeridensis]